ncbi:hypothetical protein ERY430_40277 [Erythrobacter sp. EC-HK427]|nr:hypothetical protein ERY430_40277 [Erythrobacter sp. EC-HK427]
MIPATSAWRKAAEFAQALATLRGHSYALRIYVALLVRDAQKFARCIREFDRVHGNQG